MDAPTVQIYTVEDYFDGRVPIMPKPAWPPSTFRYNPILNPAYTFYTTIIIYFSGSYQYPYDYPNAKSKYG